jgi:hypothetical protein
VKVITAKNWNLTPAADGRRYSKYPDGAATFPVSASTPANGAFPEYQIYDPVAATWGAWIAGDDGLDLGGVVTSVVGTPITSGLAFDDVLDVALNATVESNAITISEQGHQLKIRRKASSSYNANRVMDFSVAGFPGQRWTIRTLVEDVPEPPPPEEGPRDVWLTSNFSTGQIQNTTGTQDGFWVATLPVNQVGSDWIGTGSGGFGPSSGYDSRVVASEVVGGVTVLPREGSYFMRSEIFYDKDYRGINNYDTSAEYSPGTAAWIQDKPRNSYILTNTSQRATYDEEWWVGYSIHIPHNWQHELGVRDHRGNSGTLAVNASPSRTFFSIQDYTPSGTSITQWHLQYYVGDSSTFESGATSTRVLIDSFQHDIGNWTDWVIQFRVNPFSVDTNPAAEGISGAQDKTFQANKGILRIWKQSGVSRQMTLVFSVYNAPMGLVPTTAENMRLFFNQYKYGWRRNNTTITTPIWKGFDSIRYGSALQHGTGYSDVHPTRELMP